MEGPMKAASGAADTVRADTGSLPFTVDSALLRELGERLVGRHHIALAELIKNAYDADATCCEVTIADESIEVADNGHGMSYDEFHDYWMRIGTTIKERQQRSRRKKRPLTGSKGVGRLAVQFLARELELTTASDQKGEDELFAWVDWDTARGAGELTKARVRYRLRERQERYPRDATHGTRIVLRRLSHDWTEDDYRALAREIWVLRPPFKARRHGYKQEPEAFDIVFHAPQAAEAKEEFNRVLDAAIDNWRAKITGRVKDGRRSARAEVSVEFAAGWGRDERKTYSEHIPLPVRLRRESEAEEPVAVGSDCKLDDVAFEIFVYKTTGRQPSGIEVEEFRGYLENFGGVHIYDTGFHLPYYGVKQDWLDLEYDHSHRRSVSKLLPDEFQAPKALLDLPTTGRIFGTVHVDTSHELQAASKQDRAAGEVLTIQVGRDRLVDNQPFRQLKNLVRWAIDYYTNMYRRRRLEQVEVQRSAEPPARKRDRLLRTIEENRDALPVRVYETVRTEAADYVKAQRAEDEYRESLAALLGPLATAGMVALALNHETARALARLDGIVQNLRRTGSKKVAIDPEDLAAELEGWGDQIRSMRDLFAPLANEEDRRDLHRLKIRPVLQEVSQSMRPFLRGAEVDLSEVPTDFRLPLGTFADWNALFQNVFANAINALLDADEKRIACSAGRGPGRRAWVHVSDTGCGLDVPLEEAEKLFEPFERRIRISRQRRGLGLGGQGLGLSIVRMIAENRNARVHFVDPKDNYSTTFELAWGR